MERMDTLTDEQLADELDKLSIAEDLQIIDWERGLIGLAAARLRAHAAAVARIGGRTPAQLLREAVFDDWDEDGDDMVSPAEEAEFKRRREERGEA